jgi:hypothetical protein
MYSHVPRRKLHRQDAMHSLLSLAGDESISWQVAMLDPSQCFSIVLRGDWTVDLMMINTTNHRNIGPSIDRDAILDALDLVLKTYQTQRRLVSNDVLLLRSHWVTAVLDKVRTND